MDNSDLDLIANNIAAAINRVEYYYGDAAAWDPVTGILATPFNTAPTGYQMPAEIDTTLNNMVVIDPKKFGDVGNDLKGGLTLQIGDTADDFNKVTVSVDNMKVAGLGLTGLSVASQEDAGKAIQTIKDAINKVSTNRAKLGALQNRLEYTINNLDVMAENMMAANSRIRDTDMAKEMMEYTKMSILVQAAQAMLAQANMQPQSILQLLQ
jgi:flagellin